MSVALIKWKLGHVATHERFVSKANDPSSQYCKHVCRVVLIDLYRTGFAGH